MSTTDHVQEALLCAVLGLADQETSAQNGTAQIPGDARPHVIVETDMGGDTDDAAMVAFAHRLADRGVIELLAVMHNGNNEWGGAAISAINTYYGRHHVPIGTYRTAAEAGRPSYHPLIDPGQPDGPRRELSYTGETDGGHWVRLLAENFPCRYGKRLDFPDAVDVYASVLQSAPDGRVVIVNGGFLGNLSNLVAHFDADPQLAELFQRKVDRMTGAVGGVNTCDSVFPAGMAEHVLENTRHDTAVTTALGAPILDIVATRTSIEMAEELSIQNPVREAYRYKTEVEHGHRNTSLAWDWHIIDVLTSFSTIAWDDMTDDGGMPFFENNIDGWLDVGSNCGATIRTTPAPAEHLEFTEVGAHVPQGWSVLDTSQRLRSEFFENGIYAEPVSPWCLGREHRNVTATFEDGTFGGLDFRRGIGDTHVADGKLVVPTSTNPDFAGAELIVESRRYFDQTFIMRVGGVPAVDQFPQGATSQVDVDYYFWGDGRNDTDFGNAPMVRIVGWQGRGASSPGHPGYRCEVWEPGVSGYVRIAVHDVPNVTVGSPFSMRVVVQGATVQAAVDGTPVFAQPVALTCTPPSDGGLTQLRFNALCPNQRFEIDYALLRPEADGETSVDVHIDKEGTIWFSYMRDGDVLADLFGDPIALASHFVDIRFNSASIVGGIPVRMVWLDADPTTLDWLTAVSFAEWEATGLDHWVYGIRAPFLAGDDIALQFREKREMERFPVAVVSD